MSVGCHTAHRHKKRVFLRLARIAVYADYVLLGLSDHLQRLDILQKP